MNVSDWLAKYAAGDFNSEICELLDGRGDSTSSAKMWLAVASGDADVEETLLWARYVAGKIKANVIESKATASSERERAALRALGFYGVVEKYREARTFMENEATFSPIDENNQPVPNRLTANQWLGKLNSHGLMAGVKHKTALNVINKWRKELNIE